MKGAEDVLLTQRDLERRWKLSGRTLERWRAEPYGPTWIVIGGSIRYRLSDVLAWEDAHLQNTDGKGGGS
ncbi:MULTISPECIES: helix-turn-helix transcriptional regulator [Mameliella]|uniref:helix-turn-helix transcriptional regulator n=1 Tax=Mameliella TaxID=1434019 RepID=UPI000B5354C9|nr:MULTISPECIES: hypothetical protein [Mameliella]OWV55457.1 hypothetical protein CDZ98_19030 [Mameliella alba]